MKPSGDLLKCIAKVVLKNAGNVFGVGVAGNLVLEVWEGWEKIKKSEAERKAEIEALAQQPAGALNKEVAQILDEVAPNQPPEVKQAVAGYLNQVPGMIRRSLKRSSDARGNSAPAHLRLTKPEDLLSLLPRQLPRFQPGQRPLAGIDLELEELLGVGGFGEVWKAKNPLLANATPVALKFCLDATAAKSLQHEAAMLDRVMKLGKETGIIRLQHTYLSATPPCLEYEYVAGGDLCSLIAEWHQEGRTVSVNKAARIVLRLARIVAVAHQQGVVHRDLKPANILLQPLSDGKLNLKIADFGIGGIAAQQALEQTRGAAADDSLATAVRGAYTPLYASPQQVRGEPPDPGDDVYSLGVIWYQLLTGSLTTGAPTGRGWQSRFLVDGNAPAWLALLESCIEQEREHRPAHAGILGQRLEAALAEAPRGEEGASPIMDVPAAPPHAARRPAIWLGACAVIGLLLGGGALLAVKWGYRARPVENASAGPEASPPMPARSPVLAPGDPPAPKVAKIETPVKPSPPPAKPEPVKPAPHPCQLFIDNDDPDLRITVRQQGKLTGDKLRNQGIDLKPGTYDIELSGVKGLRPSRERITIQPTDRAVKLGTWRAQVAWPAEALRLRKVPAPVLNWVALNDLDFRDPAHSKDLFPEKESKTGASIEYRDRKLVVVLQGDQYINRRWKAPPYADIAIRMVGRVTGSPLTEWGLGLGSDAGKNAGILIKLNGKGEFEVTPFLFAPASFRGFRVGPLTHPALKTGSATNSLLAILRGQELELYVNDVAVCDPITLPQALAPANARLTAEAKGAPGVAEFERVIIWSARTVPTPEARGALPVR